MRSRSRVFAATLLALTCFPGRVAPQAQGEVLPLGRSVTLSSSILGEAREIWLYTPPGYKDGGDSYPVLYLLDGEFTFPFTVGIVDFLSKTHRIPPLLVVGVVNVDRTRDYTPEPGEAETQRYSVSGGAPRFLRFLEEELLPWVDAEFRTQPYRILAGHSHGGLFTAFAFAEDAPFQAFIASSPSVFWNEKSQVERIEEVVEQGGRNPKTLFLTVGSEREEIMSGIHALTGVLETSDPDWVTWKYLHLEGKDHEEMPFPSFFEGLDFTFLPLRDPEPISELGFEGYRQGLLDRFGFDVPLPVGTLFSGFALAQRRSCQDMVDMMRYWHRSQPASFLHFTDDWVAEGEARLTRGEVTCAVGLFQLLGQVRPESFDVLKGLGDALLAAEDSAKALASYRRALELSPDDEDLQRLVGRLSGGGGPEA